MSSPDTRAGVDGFIQDGSINQPPDVGGSIPFRSSLVSRRRFLYLVGLTIAGIAAEPVRGSETDGILNSPAYFNYQNQDHEWVGSNDWSYEFSNENRLVGTYKMFLRTGGNRIYQDSSQLNNGNNSYYLEALQGYEVLTGGILVKPEKNTAILLALISMGYGVFRTAGAEMWDVRDPHNLAKRIYIPWTGSSIAVDGRGYSSFTGGVESSGRDYIDVGMAYAYDPAQRQTRRHYFDSSFKPVGDWVPAPQHRNFLPIISK